MEAIEAGKNFDKIFLKKGERSDSFRELMQMIKEHDLFFQTVPEEKLNRLTRKNHQGVVAFLTHVEYQRIEQVLPAIYESGEEPLILLLDRITDVRNFGAIARSAE
jgi:23S rRNA (guanosine2251-2'-O)-methyltransferase